MNWIEFVKCFLCICCVPGTSPPPISSEKSEFWMSSRLKFNLLKQVNVSQSCCQRFAESFLIVDIAFPMSQELHLFAMKMGQKLWPEPLWIQIKPGEGKYEHKLRGKSQIERQMKTVCAEAMYSLGFEKISPVWNRVSCVWGMYHGKFLAFNLWVFCWRKFSPFGSQIPCENRFCLVAKSSEPRDEWLTFTNFIEQIFWLFLCMRWVSKKLQEACLSLCFFCD